MFAKLISDNYLHPEYTNNPYNFIARHIVQF